MEQGLALPRPTREIARCAMLRQLRDMSPNRPPALDLAKIVGMTTAGIIAAIPLEPAARIVGMDPAFVSPHLQRLGGVHPEVIEGGARPIRRKPGASEPVRREFAATIGHIFAAENTERQKLLRRELGTESRAKLTTDRFRPPIRVALLHLVAHDDAHRLHAFFL